METSKLRQAEELDKIKKENDEFIKMNEELEKENASLNEEIETTIQKIDINTLLKEVDIEDMRQLSHNNQNMTKALNSLLNKW